MPIHPVVLEKDRCTLPSQSELFAQLAQLKAELDSALKQVQALTTERDQLKASHERLRDELELLKRRIFIAKAERVDSQQLEFFHKLSELNELEKELATELNPEYGSRCK